MVSLFVTPRNISEYAKELAKASRDAKDANGNVAIITYGRIGPK
jgi:hypothetical protein